MVKTKEIVLASLDLLFPPACSCCKKQIEDSSTPLCIDCFEKLKFIQKPYCLCCGRVFPGDGENHLCGICLQSSWFFDKTRSLFAYEEAIALLISDLKYAGKSTGLETFQWLSKQSTILDDLNTPDIILPVPLHPKRLRKRGFNQALILAKTIFPGEKKKIKYDVLIRKNNTPSQAGLSGKERRNNLKNVFTVKRPSMVAERTVLIIDDVFTTGSTTNECAKALKKAGAVRVDILTVCRSDKITSQ